MPHVAVSVWRGMSPKQVHEAIKSELSQGFVMGSDEDARLLSRDFVSDEKRADQLTRAAYAAINRDVTPAKKGARKLFMDLDDDDDVYAYFVFVIE